MMVQIQERDAELRGEKRGELRGIAIGEKRGIAIGEERGILNTRIENAKAMLANGLAVEMVSKFSGLSVEQVLAIKAQLAVQWPSVLPPSAAKMDDEWRHAYMMVQIQERDAELRGEKRGELRGIAIGEKRGEQRGEKRGISIGEQNASLRIAKQLLLSNLPIDAIANACDLTIEQVLAIKAQLAAH